MPKLFDDNRNYVLGDPELELLGSKAKLAQWRHYAKGPAYYKIGRKVIYTGVDLNAWAEAQRKDPNEAE